MRNFITFLLVLLLTGMAVAQQPITVPKGGTGAGTFTANGVLFGNVTGAIQATAAPTVSGQALTWNGNAFAWAAPSGTVANALTAGTGLTSAGTFDGSVARTFAIDFGTSHTTVAYGDHAHTGAYEPAFTTLSGTKLPAFTGGDVTSTSGSVDLQIASGAVGSTEIANGAVALADMANLAANSILGNNTGTPTTPIALTAAQVRTLLNVSDGANAYVHPNHTGEVTSVGDGATTIANDAVTYAKLQNVGANSILGNNTGIAANAIELTGAQVKTMLALVKGDVGLGNVTNDAQVKKSASSTDHQFVQWNGTTGDAIENSGYSSTSFAAASHTHSAATDITGIVPSDHGGAGSVDGILLADGAGNVSAATDGSDYLSSSTGQPLDADLTAIAALVGTGSKIIKWNGAAWALGDDNDTVYSHPTGDGNLHVPATSTTNNGKVLTAGASAGSLSWQTPSNDTLAGLTKTSGNVVVADGAAWQSVAMSGDVTINSTGATTIGTGAVTLAKMANMATASILGRNSAGSGAPEVLSASTAKSLLALNNVTNDAQIAKSLGTAKGQIVGFSANATPGAVPAGTDGYYLKANSAAANGLGVEWAALSGINAAPPDAKYIVQTADGTLTNEQALGALATGIVKNTTTTGVLSIAVAGTDFQGPDADLTAIAGLSSADSNFIVGSAAGWVVESGSTARTSMGLGNSATLNTGTTNGTVATGDHSHSQISPSLRIGDTGTPTAGTLQLVDNDGDTVSLTIDDTSNNLKVGATQVSLAGHAHTGTYEPAFTTLSGTKLPAFTGGDVTSTSGTVDLQIAADAVTYAELQNVAANSILGNNTGIAANAIELTAAQVKTMLSLTSSDVGLGNVANISQAPVGGTYLTLTANSVLTNEANVGSLGTGILKINGTGAPTLAAAGTDFEGVITAGTTSQYWKGDKSWATLDAAAVGLGNVTNESKATMFSSPTFTGTVAAASATFDGNLDVRRSGATTQYIRTVTDTTAHFLTAYSAASAQKAMYIQNFVNGTEAVGVNDVIIFKTGQAGGTQTEQMKIDGYNNRLSVSGGLNTAGPVSLGFLYNSGTAQNQRGIINFYIPRLADQTNSYMMDYQDELAYTGTEGKGTVTFSVAPTINNDTTIPFRDDSSYCVWGSTSGLAGGGDLVIEIDRDADYILANGNQYFNLCLVFRGGAVAPSHVKVEATDKTVASGGVYSTVYDQDVPLTGATYETWMSPAFAAPSGSHIYKLKITLTVPAIAGSNQLRLQRVMLYHPTHPLWDPWRLHITGATKNSRMVGHLEPYKTNSINLGSATRVWANAYATRVETKAVEGNASKALTDASTAGICEVTVASGEMVGGTLFYTAKGSSGTDRQSRSGSIPFTIINANGTVTSAFGTATDAVITSSGTLTAAFTITNGTGKATLNANVDSSLTTPVVSITYQVQINGTHAITFL